MTRQILLITEIFQIRSAEFGVNAAGLSWSSRDRCRGPEDRLATRIRLRRRGTGIAAFFSRRADAANREMIVSEIDQEKVNRSVRDCLQHCHGVHDVVASVAEFMAGLKAAGGWSRAEMRAVDMTVHALLHSLVYPRDAITSTRRTQRGDRNSVPRRRAR